MGGGRAGLGRLQSSRPWEPGLAGGQVQGLQNSSPVWKWMGRSGECRQAREGTQGPCVKGWKELGVGFHAERSDAI